MARAWYCLFDPRHGGMLQEKIIAKQVRLEKRDARNRRGLKPLTVEHSNRPLAPYTHRIACPKCIRAGKPGWMRPASADETAALQQQAA